MIRSGSARAILMVNPEICSAHLEWRDEIAILYLGMCARLFLLEAGDETTKGFEVLSTRCLTEFSNNIRNNND